MSKTIKSPGGVLVRVIEALNGFKTKYGHWPRTLELDNETIALLATQSLTPRGFFLLHSKIDLATHGSGLVLMMNSWHRLVTAFWCDAHAADRPLPCPAT